MVGKGRYADGDLLGAVSLLTEAIERERGLPSAHYYLALALADLDRHEEALAAVRRAVALDPDDERFRALHAHLVRVADPFGHDGDGPDENTREM